MNIEKSRKWVDVELEEIPEISEQAVNNSETQETVP